MNQQTADKIIEWLCENDEINPCDGIYVRKHHLIDFLNSLVSRDMGEEDILGYKRCICIPSNLQVGSRWIMNPDCPRHREDCKEIASRMWNEFEKEYMRSVGGRFAEHFPDWLIQQKEE